MEVTGTEVPALATRRVRTVQRGTGPRQVVRLRRENALLRLAAAGAPPRRLAAALLRLVDTLLPGCPCEVLLGDAQAGFLEVVGTRGFRAERGLGCRIPLGVGVTGAAAREGRALWVPDVSRDLRYIPGVPGARWELALPLRAGGGVCGVVDLEAPRGTRPSAAQRRHLRRLTALLAPAFARALPGNRILPLRLAVLPGRAGASARPDGTALLLAPGQLRALYQPVAELEGRRVIGYEAEIAGPADGPWERPARVFAAAQNPSEGAELDLARLRAALGAWRAGCGRLFLGVRPESVRRAGFLAGVAGLLREHGLGAADLVLEVSLVGTQVQAVRRALSASAPGGAPAGFVLAVDRFGAGAASAQALIELRPAYVKLDPVLVRGVDRDFGRRTYIESLCYYTRRAGTRLIAVGVATPGELTALRQLGVAYGQGELLGPAAPLPA